MPSDPIDKRPFESDVMSDLFGLKPFVPQDFGLLSLELPVKSRGCQGIEGLVELSWFHTHRHRPGGLRKASASRRPVNARIPLNWNRHVVPRNISTGDDTIRGLHESGTT